MSGEPGLRCALMRGGSSKGAFFLAEDLPAEPAARDDLLLRVMGSPDPRQIDGVGGAHPLTSKVAIVSRSESDEADLDYLFVQVAVDAPETSTAQTCGNLLAAVGPFAIERGLAPAADGQTTLRVRLVNTGATATVTVQTPGGRVTYSGSTLDAGVPFGAAPVLVGVEASTAPLLPTGLLRQELAGVSVTCIDNGMPSVLLAASELGLQGDEDPSELEANATVAQRIQQIRREAFEAMGLPGEWQSASVPKIVLLCAPRAGGTLATRSFIPVRTHQAIGVLGAASVAAAIRLPGSVAADIVAAAGSAPADDAPIVVEHPSGALEVAVPVLRVATASEPPVLGPTALVRTARMLFDGRVFPRD